MISPRKHLWDSQGYDQQMYIEDWLLKLDLNENIMGPSPKVLESIKNITENDIKFYPAYGELINKIAAVHSIDSNMVLPTNGADEAISYIFSTFVEEDDFVVSVTPSFAMYEVYAKNMNCNYVEVKYDEKWKFPVEKFIRRITKNTKIAIITTPNSPTGESISREDLIQVLNACSNCLILLDITYASFAQEDFIDLIKQYPNIIYTKSLSKDHALAGLRIGYIVAHPDVLNLIKRIISPFSVNTIAANAAIAALDDTEYFEVIKNKVQESKQYLTKGLSSIANAVYPSDANFLLVDFGAKAEFIYKRLLNSGIKVKAFLNNPLLNSCFRIALPAPEQCKMIIDTIKEKKDLIVFDIDGVLVDTRESYRRAIKSTYEFYAKKEISFGKIQETKNLGGLNNDWDLTEYLLKQDGIEMPKAQIIKTFQTFYLGDNFNGYIANESLLIDPEILKDLAKKYDLAIFTGRPRPEALYVLQRWGLDLFSVIVSMDDVPMDAQKPDPCGLHKILEVINPVKVYYLGDTADDMIAAKAANVKGIGVLPPQDKSEKLKQSLIEKGATIVLSNTEDIIDVVNIEFEQPEKTLNS